MDYAVVILLLGICYLFRDLIVMVIVTIGGVIIFILTVIFISICGVIDILRGR